MPERREFSLSQQKGRVLENGVVLTSVFDGFCDIRNGEVGRAFNLPEDPNLIVGWGGETSKRLLLTGEQIILPDNFATSLLLGRGSESDVEVDVDLMPTDNMPTNWGGKDGRELLERYSMSQALTEAGAKFALEVGDLGIHRKALLLTYEPRVGILVATWDSSFAPPLTDGGELNEKRFRLESVLPGDYVLAKASDGKPVLDPMATFDGSGSKVIHDSEVVIIPGLKKYVALRYFAPKDGAPPRLIKRSFVRQDDETSEGEEKFIKDQIFKFIFPQSENH